ncbi:MAG: hypothetical protein LAP21_11465 [Acidobacteriia bacterium]|nr:hypothetical protein [Terriglobia bacterium]
MKQTAPTTAGHAQVAEQSAPSSPRQSAVAGGRLAELAAMMNESPRVRSLAQLKEIPGHDLMGLAEELNQGPSAQLRVSFASDLAQPENAPAQQERPEKTEPLQEKFAATPHNGSGGDAIQGYPVQRKEPGDGELHTKGGKAGPALLALVAELEELACEAALLGGEQGAAESQRLRGKLLELQTIAGGDDETLKAETLNRLHKELANLGVPAKASGEGETEGATAQLTPADPLQRLTGLEIGLIVGGVVIGTALLAAGIWALVRRCRAARPTVGISLQGPAHDAPGNHSYATVTSHATLTHPSQQVVYEIRWDAAVVPGGNHLGQQPLTASNGWVVDRSRDGHPIGDRTIPEYAYYFSNNGYSTGDAQNGLHYYFPDGIEQRELNGGSWWFRIRVIDQNGTTLVTSQEQEIDWRH